MAIDDNLVKVNGKFNPTQVKMLQEVLKINGVSKVTPFNDDTITIYLQDYILEVTKHKDSKDSPPYYATDTNKMNISSDFKATVKGAIKDFFASSVSLCEREVRMSKEMLFNL